MRKMGGKPPGISRIQNFRGDSWDVLGDRKIEDRGLLEFSIFEGTFVNSIDQLSGVRQLHSLI